MKKIIRTIICTNWHPRLLSHYHYPTDEYLHLTPVCITILSTSCKTNHLCIVYIIPGKNWHLVVMNFKFISYRPWVELSTGSVVRGRQQRCGSGHFRELTWYLNDVHPIIIMFCASPSCVMIIVRLLNMTYSLHFDRRFKGGSVTVKRVSAADDCDGSLGNHSQWNDVGLFCRVRVGSFQSFIYFSAFFVIFLW